MSNTENRTDNSGTRHIAIYFTDFLKGARKLWWICVILAVIIGGFRYVSDYRSYVPKYSSSATFTVTSQNAQSTISGISSYSFYYDASTTSQLTETFPYILQCNILQDAIINDLDLTYMPASLSASSVPGANLFTLTATGTDPQMTYDVLISAIENYPEAAKYVVGNIRFDMIETPMVAASPYNKANYMSNAMEGAVIGIAIGICFILLYALMRRTIRTNDDIKRELNLTSFGVVPAVKFKKYVQPADRKVLFTNEKVSSGFLESFRVIRNIFINQSSDKKVFMVTSTAPGEGKTTTAVNFALSLVPLGKKVLLVDADLHHPSILSTLRIEDGSDELVLKSEINKNSTVFAIKTSEKSGADIMTVTPDNNKNPFENISGLKDVIDDIRSEYDYIFIDTPPCGLVSDAMNISVAADAAIYVIRQDVVRVSKIRAGIDNLLSTETGICGCILNGAVTGVSGYGYGYDYGYGYGYGKKYGYGRKHAYGQLREDDIKAEN